MSSSKKQYEHIFNGLTEYMFTSENILRYTQLETHSTQVLQKKKIKPKIIKMKSSDTIYYPHQKDEIFWCFFIAYKGMDTYKFNNLHSFTNEKEFKISSVEKLRENADVLKQLKIKHREIEDELVNKPKISLQGLHTLCIIYKMSLLYVWGRKYCEFSYNEEPCYIIITDDSQKKIGIKNNISKSELDNIRDNYLHIENIKKPLRAISGYMIKELHDICKKLEISILDTSGKKLNKKALYENIIKNL